MIFAFIVYEFDVHIMLGDRFNIYLFLNASSTSYMYENSIPNFYSILKNLEKEVSINLVSI